MTLAEGAGLLRACNSLVFSTDLIKRKVIRKIAIGGVFVFFDEIQSNGSRIQDERILFTNIADRRDKSV